jgi:cytidylate kinase
MIIDIRGAFGSGKSTIVHRLLEAYGFKFIIEKAQKIGCYVNPLDCGILGTYQRQCGGVDSIKTPEEVCRRLRLFNEKYKNVILEGIVTGHTFQRYSLMARELGLEKYTFCFLDTPLDLCIQRVEQRRKEKGNDKPFDPRNVIKEWHSVWERVRPKFIKAGHPVVILDHKDPIPQVLELLENS